MTTLILFTVTDFMGRVLYCPREWRPCSC